MDYEAKFKFYLPRYAIENSSLTAVDYVDFRKDFIKSLQDSGASRILSHIVTDIAEIYEMDLEILTVYCSKERKTALQRLFLDKTSQYRNDLKTDEFMYEEDDVVVKIIFGNENDSE